MNVKDLWNMFKIQIWTQTDNHYLRNNISVNKSNILRKIGYIQHFMQNNILKQVKAAELFYVFQIFYSHWHLFGIICRLLSPAKIFLQPEHHIEILVHLWCLYIWNVKYEVPLIVSSVYILPVSLFPSLWKIINDSKIYVPTVPMIMYFKYFSCSKTTFLFSTLW